MSTNLADVARLRWMPAIVALALALAGLAQAASPPVSPTISIGNQIKNTVGTVVNLEPGDIACYMTLKNDTGKEFNERADFALCDKKPSLKGQRVQLRYQLQNVQAAEYQGNPECRKSERIPLVMSATVLGKGAATPQGSAAAKQVSFCTPRETVVFTCYTGAKLVSVCASPNLSPTAGYVQYRFGKPGEPLEITLPEGEVHPRKAAYGTNVGYSGGGASWLRFRKAPYAYVVYSGVGRWGPKGATMAKQGVAVENKGKVVANLKCTGNDSGELGPQWFEKAGFQPNDKEEFFIPD
jgi:hypothetical protein